MKAWKELLMKMAASPAALLPPDEDALKIAERIAPCKPRCFTNTPSDLKPKVHEIGCLHEIRHAIAEALMRERAKLRDYEHYVMTGRDEQHERLIAELESLRERLKSPADLQKIAEECLPCHEGDEFGACPPIPLHDRRRAVASALASVQAEERLRLFCVAHPDVNLCTVTDGEKVLVEDCPRCLAAERESWAVEAEAKAHFANGRDERMRFLNLAQRIRGSERIEKRIVSGA